MARILMSLSFFLVLLILSPAPFLSQARLLNGDHPRSPTSKGVEISFNGLDLKGTKTGGPSPGGKGHGSTNARHLGVVKNSGPSPGEGH